MQHQILKKTLSNGLTILVRPTHVVPKVSTQLWYHVGSKNEQSGQKGIAHLIEHMIFKGTEKLSESDINLITHKLSGSCNAFTSYDYTGYLFDFPSQNWEVALPIMADCMRNCTFKQSHLNSEMKAVIQELKMYRDDYQRGLAEQMITAIFQDHPYHYPIIGFKQDLWSVHPDTLKEFYQRHYIPNNATLVVVGDVDPERVFSLAEEYFGTIPADPNYQRESFYHSPDLQKTSIIIHRDIKQSVALFAFVMPPSSLKTDYLLNILEWVLGSGKGSRLYRLLVDELHLATDVATFSYDLFDSSVFFIAVEPTQAAPHHQTIDQITDIISRECKDIAQNGLTSDELTRARNQALSEFFSDLENTQHQAYAIGETFIKTGDENYLNKYLNYPIQALEADLKELVGRYCRASIMHQGVVLPLEEGDHHLWKSLQDIADIEDARILAQATRPDSVQEGNHVHSVPINPMAVFHFPKPHRIELANGLTALYAKTNTVPKIDILIQLKANHQWDPEDRQGLYMFMTMMMQEGTKNYPGHQFADELEKLGISFEITPGAIHMSVLSDDLEKALHLLTEAITNASFPEEAVEKIRARLLAQLDLYWDTPTQFIMQLAKDAIYATHPYHKNSIGTPESIKNITREDLLSAYRQWITPQQANVALVGDLKNYDIPGLLQKTLATWQGKPIIPIEFPVVDQSKELTLTHYLNRDQITLCFAMPSVSRFDQNFDALLLCDQILTGGVLRSMSSRLFDLREQSGLFYTIGGSLVSGADIQPGMCYIRTIVSPDRLQEAKERIIDVIQKAAVITDQELQEARNALAASLINQFETNRGIAQSFLFAEKYRLPTDYFDKRAESLAKISKETVQQAVEQLLNNQKFITICVGRI